MLRVLLVVLVLLLIGSWGAWQLLIEAPAAGGPETLDTLHVSPGMSLGLIARQLEERGLLDSPNRLKLAGRLFGLESGIQQGRFPLSSRMSPRELLEALQHYSVPTVKLRIPEGARAPEIAGLLGAVDGLDSARVMTLVGDSAFIVSLGLDQPDLEGLLFPDTYLVSQDENEAAILRRLVARSLGVVDRLSRDNRPAGVELRELLTLASIIQGEYQLAGEADTIAAVYRNRLRLGMKLQADPTVQILIEDGPRRLLLKDLEIDSPYNTYRHRGLPPGPIGNPGQVALAAAWQPAECDYLYFVAQGDGSHAFAITYDEHLENRKPLDRMRRRLRQDSRRR